MSSMPSSLRCITLSRYAMSSSEMACSKRTSCQELQSVMFTAPYMLSLSFTGAKASRSSFESTTEAPVSAVPRSVAWHSGESLASAPLQAADSAKAARTGAQLDTDCASPATTRRPRARCRFASAGDRSIITYSKAAAHRRQTGGETPSSLDRTHFWISAASWPEPAPISTTRKGARSSRWIHITSRSLQKTRAKCGESTMG
mmetsp:Transcript_5/g.19  ORF Transcript_5/g.19 Transcript_5/m.19 type:complete len:202 (-) Transcript_5:686-1291(-)